MHSRLPGLLTAALMALYTVTFSIIGIRQHDAFLTHKEDLGQIDQAVWNSLQGRWLVETDEDRQSTRLTDHAEPILIAASLVFLIWDDVRALLILQAVVAALGAWAVYLLAKEVFTTGAWRLCIGRRSVEVGAWIAAAFALSYLLFPALEAAQLAEFHAAPLVTAPTAFALLYLHRRQWRRFLLAGLMVTAVKEEMALVGVMLGIAGVVVALRERPRRMKPSPASLLLHPSTWLLAASLVWFISATFIIIPYYGASKYASSDSIYFRRFGELGATPGAVVRTLLTNPQLVLRIMTEPARLAYVAGLSLSTGLLALLAPETLLLSAPLLMANWLSNFPAQYSGDFHYSAPLAPFFVVAAIYGFARSARRLNGIPLVRWGLLVWFLLCVLVYHRMRGYSPLGENFYLPEITRHHQTFERLAAQIPRGARLSATPPLFPHLSHREVIYLFPTVADAEYVLLDASGVTDMHPNDFHNAVNQLLDSRQFGVVDGADAYLLLKRGAGNTTLPNTFFDFARAPGAQPQYPTDVTFGDALTLVGFDVVPDARWHRVVTRWYWKALRPLEADLRVYPFYHDGKGEIVEDTTQRTMIATVWYPPPRWRLGEVVRTETIPWDVGDSFALAAGVMRGNDWDRKGRRLATTTGTTQVEMGRFAWQGKRLIRLPD